MTAKRRADSGPRSSHEGRDSVPLIRRLPRGLGSMRDVPLNIDPRIDLTQPIYEQVLALQKADREADKRAAAERDEPG